MEDPNLINGIQRGTNQPEDVTQAAMRMDLTAEQLKFFKNANSGQQPFQGFGGIQGLKEAATGVAILFVLGFIFKYILHIG